MEQEKKRSPYQLLWEWAGAYHGSFYAAVIFAVLGVAVSYTHLTLPTILRV